MAAPTNLEVALRSIKRIGSFSEAEKDALQKAFRKSMFPGSWDIGTPNDNDILQYDAATDAWSPQTLPGGTYTSLGDTPASYSGDGGTFVTVNTGETALEHTTPNISALGNVSSTTDAPNTDDVISWSGTIWRATTPLVQSVNGLDGALVLDIDNVTPTTTKGDIIVEDGSNAIRVAIGTDTHVLTADSAQPSGLKWAVSPAGFADPMTTRGDIIYKDSGGTTVRLGAGTVGQVLTSDGTDISWAASVSGTTVFTGLTDTPATYVGQANKYVVVNAGASALEFTSVSPVTSVGGTSPVASSGGTTPVISIQEATAAQHGYMTSTYANKLDNIENSADVTDATNVAAAGAWIGDITVSASSPSGGSDGDIWFQV